MAVGLQQLGIRNFTADPPERKLFSFSFRSYSVAWCLSLIVHVSLMVWLGLFFWSERQLTRAVASSQFEWMEEVPIPRFEFTESQAHANLKADAADSSAATAVFKTNSAVATIEPKLRISLLAAPEEIAMTPAAMAEYVGASFGVSKDGQGFGSGSGNGLFGDADGANSYVFVIDRSQSMNNLHHANETGTRFQRLQVELINFIGQLRPSQTFFVIFFDEKPMPMPAEGLVPATEANKLRYLNWIRELAPEGRTDPRVAIKLAIKLAPEQIFFLSDGELDPFFQKQILRNPPGPWALNSYSFGTHGGEFMKVLAEKHGGQYTLIP